MNDVCKTTISLDRLSAAIRDGVTYLAQHQLPNGEFCCYVAPDDAMQEWCAVDSAVFPTSLIASSLLTLEQTPLVKSILKEAEAFLRYQMMRGGVWNYFTIGSRYFRLCPTDVDDTVVASHVLQTLGGEMPDNTRMLLDNRNANGLFYTWYTLRPNKSTYIPYWLILLRVFKYPIKSQWFWYKNECSGSDIDAAVNANVLFHWGYNQYTEPIVPYLLDIIINEKEADCDKWYRNPFMIYYFLTRNYAKGINMLEPIRIPIIQRTLLAFNPHTGMVGHSVLDTALAICALVNLGYKGTEIHTAAQYLVDNQSVYGNWVRWSIYYCGPSKRYCWGSEEMTTGFCLEALGLYKQTYYKD